MLAMTPTISVGDITGIFYIVFFNCLVFHRSATKQTKTQEQFHWVVHNVSCTTLSVQKKITL